MGIRCSRENEYCINKQREGVFLPENTSLCWRWKKACIQLEALRERRPPWPRQIITLILLYIAHCKNVEPWLWKTTHPAKKKKKKFWIITFTTIWVCYHYYGVFLLILLILQYPDHHQNLISSSLYYSRPVHKMSSQSVHNFLSNVVHRQTNRQTN